eukprot:Transcript_22002.p2 GENE.Transcript_22002~~Transcript_22002.p2  ORF type:complete len:414 (+),score=137.44 Transcript_22002:1262-2503(+)
MALGEMAIGLGFLLPYAWSRKLAVLLGLLLHLGICLTPPPNNITPFSVCAACRFYFAIPTEASAAVARAAVSPRLLLAHLLSGAALYALALTATHGSQHRDVPLVFYGLLASVLLHALLLPPAPSAAVTTAACAGTRPPAAGSAWVPPRAAMLAAAALWAASVPLGLMDISAPNMFSNAKQHGGSNHILGGLAPTGLLQRLGSGGGVVKVETTSSSWLRARHPFEDSDLFTPRARSLLRSLGHTGRQWHSAAGMIVGPGARGIGAEKEAPVAYTLPALELRRVLARAAAHHDEEADGRGFTVEVRWLPGAEGGEAWRRGEVGAAPLYRLGHTSGGGEGGGFYCHTPGPLTVAGGWAGGLRWLGGGACSAAEEAALLPGRGLDNSLAERVAALPQAWKSMPVLDDGAEEVHCGS